jgi:D-alanyl-D-alanine carboxypeptidase
MLNKTPIGLDELIHTFGSIDDPAFENRNIVTFTLPFLLYYEGKKISQARCHRLIVENFQKAFEDIKAAGLDEIVKNFSGIYAKRAIRGFASHASTHSWGVAIDLDAEEYPLGDSKRFPDPVVSAFHNAGFFYGGDFISRKDPMHFQFCEKY